MLGRAVRTEELVLKTDAHLRHHSAAAFARRSDLDRGNQVFAPVGTQHADRDLAAGKNHGFGEVHQHKTERGGGIGHRVGTVQHDKAVVSVVVVTDQPRQFAPQFRRHIRRVDRREVDHLQFDIEFSQVGKLVVNGTEVERRQYARFRIGLHADRAARVDQQYG